MTAEARFAGFRTFFCFFRAGAPRERQEFGELIAVSYKLTA
jgi:hypothetical protein